MNRVRLFLMLVLLALVIAACGTPVEPVILEASFQGAGTGTIEVGAPANTTLSKTKTKVSLDVGTKVTLTAKPAAGSTFGGWAGACSGATLTCSVTMNAGKKVTATFNLAAPTSHTVTFGLTGNGSIHVMPNDVDITTDGDTLDVDDGTVLTLTAVAGDAATSFSSWTGACSAETTATCTVTITSDTSIGANFTTAGNHNLTVSFIRGLGTGSVSDGGDIACDYAAGAATGPGTGTCGTSLTEGATVTLTATPDASSTLLEWGGDCSGAALTCDLTLDGDKTVTARFVSATPTDLAVAIVNPEDNAEEFLEASTATAYPDPNDVVIGTGFLELTYSSRWVSDQAVGLRFPNVNIPAGAEIVSAVVEFTAHANVGAGTADAAAAKINIYGQDSVTPPVFLDTAASSDPAAKANVTNRLASATAPVVWDIAAGAWATNTTHATADIAGIVTAIATKDGWDPSSNAIVLVLQNDAVGTPAVQTGRRLVNNASTGGVTGAPVLKVTYR